MPTLVHLTPEQNAARILRAGIKPARPGPGGVAGVYCMPVLPDFSVTHQWLRELKRWSRARTLVGITFRLPPDEPVWVGRYDREHVQLPLGEAIRLILRLEDARGYQLLVPRPIAPRELRGVRRLPQVVGWRYWPGAHGRRPCTCIVCLPKGQYKSASIRARLDTDGKPPTKATLLAQLAAATTDEETEDALWQLRSRWRGGGEELASLVNSPSARVRAALAITLGVYRGPAARRLLRQLADDADETVRDEAQLSLGESAGSRSLPPKYVRLPRARVADRPPGIAGAP
jgi:hypothetical protein